MFRTDCTADGVANLFGSTLIQSEWRDVVDTGRTTAGGVEVMVLGDTDEGSDTSESAKVGSESLNVGGCGSTAVTRRT